MKNVGNADGISRTKGLSLDFTPLVAMANNFASGLGFSPWPVNIGLTMATALVYILGIDISDLLVTTLSANRITPIWLPAAFTFSLFFYFGDRVIPGIVIGSVLGLVHPLTTFQPPLDSWQIIFLGIAFTTANVGQAWLGNRWLKTNLGAIKKQALVKNVGQNFQGKNIIDPLALINPFHHLQTSLAFILSALMAPMVSASLAMGALVVIGKIPWADVCYSWLTWWLGSALAMIIFCPILIDFQPRLGRLTKRKIIGLGLVVIASILIGLLSFWWNYPVAYLFLPLLLAIVFYFGRFFGSLAVVITAVVAIILTSVGRGMFMGDQPNNSLIFLQIFSSVLSATTLLFAALIEEKKQAQQMLIEAIDNLEAQVEERTQALVASQKALQNSNIELEKLVNIDALINIPNRRYFECQFEMEWGRLAWTGEPLTLMVLDLDCFKAYNDNYGHAQGDVCLCKVGQVLQRSLHRPHSDLVARYGGEEFVVLLSGVDTLGAIAVAERILAELRAMALPHQFSTAAAIVTVSIGISVTIPDRHGSRQELFVKADQALYLAKKGGKNQYQFLCLNACP